MLGWRILPIVAEPNWKVKDVDFPLIWWLMPYGLVPDKIRVWIRDNASCWLGGYCYSQAVMAMDHSDRMEPLSHKRFDLSPIPS